MKVIFLDIDGVISTFEKQWRLDCQKIQLLNRIIDETNAKIVISSSWRHGCSNVKEMINKFKTFRLPYELEGDLSFEYFLNNIIYITESKGCRGEDIQYWLDTHDDIESYVILDDDSDMLDSQLFNFVQTDGFEGLTEREVKLCISILNNEKIINPIRLNYTLRNEWINNCRGLEITNIKERIKKYGEI